MNTIWEEVKASRDHTGTSFENHLLGTEDILKRWQQEEYVQLAGRYHAVYGNPNGRGAICDMNSNELIEEIGPDAEHLVRLWAIVDRNSLPNTVGLFLANSETIPLRLFDGEIVDVTRQQFVDMAHLQTANELDVAKRRNRVKYNVHKLKPVLVEQAVADLNVFKPTFWELLTAKIRPKRYLKKIRKTISGFAKH